MINKTGRTFWDVVSDNIKLVSIIVTALLLVCCGVIIYLVVNDKPFKVANVEVGNKTIVHDTITKIIHETRIIKDTAKPQRKYTTPLNNNINEAKTGEKVNVKSDEAKTEIQAKNVLNGNVSSGSNVHVGDVTVVNEPPSELDEDYKKRLLKFIENLALQLPIERRKIIELTVEPSNLKAERLASDVKDFLTSKGYFFKGSGQGVSNGEGYITANIDKRQQCILLFVKH